MYKLYMEFENPTLALTGKKESVQGFTVCGDTAVVLYHTGVCALYNLRTRSPQPVAVCRLGSYNNGDPDNRYTNHANDVVCGTVLPGETLPLLYVTAGNSGECDEKGYISYCAVEQLHQNGDSLTAETLQKIYYRHEENSDFAAPGWGWPAALPDAENGWYYLLSARYRTRRDIARPDNAYIVTKFRLPDPTAGDVTLTPKDIVEQFTLPFHIFFTQGGTVKDGTIWYTFGCGNEAHPNALCAIDPVKKEYLLEEDLSATPFGNDEVECCAFWGSRLLLNTQSGKIYEKI